MKTDCYPKGQERCGNKEERGKRRVGKRKPQTAVAENISKVFCPHNFTKNIEIIEVTGVIKKPVNALTPGIIDKIIICQKFAQVINNNSG